MVKSRDPLINLGGMDSQPWNLIAIIAPLNEIYTRLIKNGSPSCVVPRPDHILLTQPREYRFDRLCGHIFPIACLPACLAVSACLDIRMRRRRRRQFSWLSTFHWVTLILPLLPRQSRCCLCNNKDAAFMEYHDTVSISQISVTDSNQLWKIYWTLSINNKQQPNCSTVCCCCINWSVTPSTDISCSTSLIDTYGSK